MRSNNTIKNSIFSSLETISNIIINFISRTIFIYILGKEFLGLNGLFSSILIMLNLFELGIGSAIIYYLYSPLAENNKEKIKSLMKLYKKAFNIIALIILCVGLLLIPFIPILVGSLTVNVNIILIYLLFLLSTVCSYLFTYKRGLIYADQKNYIINITHTIYLVILNISQLIVLYFTKNYYLYLFIRIICQIIENLVLNFIANKKYPFIKEKNTNNLTKKEMNLIYTKIKALFFHKTANVLVTGVDNVLISYFFGVVTVGLYSNYSLIISSILTLISQIVASSIPSVGNLLVTEKSDKTFIVFKRIRFINFYLTTIFSTCILYLTQPFIEVWLGNEYLLSFGVLVVLIINFYQKNMRQTYIVFKDAAGIWEEDKYIPITEAILNILLSILFIKLFGLVGVFIGTIVSGLLYWLYSYPLFVYKKIFNRNYFSYLKETLGYIILFGIICIFVGIIINYIKISNIYLKLIINFIICILIPNIIIFLRFMKNDYFNYIKKIIIRFIRK